MSEDLLKKKLRNLRPWDERRKNVVKIKSFHKCLNASVKKLMMTQVWARFKLMGRRLKMKTKVQQMNNLWTSLTNQSNRKRTSKKPQNSWVNVKRVHLNPRFLQQTLKTLFKLQKLSPRLTLRQPKSVKGFRAKFQVILNLWRSKLTDKWQWLRSLKQTSWKRLKKPTCLKQRQFQAWTQQKRQEKSFLLLLRLSYLKSNVQPTLANLLNLNTRKIIQSKVGLSRKMRGITIRLNMWTHRP